MRGKKVTPGMAKVTIKSPEEIAYMRESCRIVAEVLRLMKSLVRPGITTLELDKIAEEYIRDNGGVPGFKGLYGFPNTLCMSLNASVVHGIPNDKPLEEGDIISVDCGVIKNGFHGDHAYTFAVGAIAPEVQKLLDVTKECLYIGIEQFKSGNRIGDIGFAIQQHAEKNGYGVVRELCGHGLGKKLHEDPSVFNFGKRGRGDLLEPGAVLALEPMVTVGTNKIKQLPDESYVTADGKLSAHFEHTVAITKNGPQILTML